MIVLLDGTNLRVAKLNAHLLFQMLVLTCVIVCAISARALRVGVGIADVTGPPAEIGFMGYANFEQSGQGIHLRQFARAFVLVDDGSSRSTRMVFVSVDAAMMGNGVRKEVIKRLQKRFGDLYNENNVILSGTHTHSTPGGFLMDFLFDLPILGFVKETYIAYIAGILKSIFIAHNNLKPARMEYGEAELLDANINRSPTSYLLNPPEERARYKYDVDKTLAQVRFLSQQNKVIGVINWFAVHPTSMNNTNRLISSDNVGYASILMEKALNGDNTLPGKGGVVCAFASSNLGDVSPNTRGPRCERSGRPCDNQHALCAGHKERCFASGPGRDMFDSTRIIATKLFDAAMKVLEAPGEDLTGPLNIVHQFVEMPKQEVSPYDPITDTFNTNVVEAAAGEMNKIAGAIESAVSKATRTSDAKEPLITIDSDASYVGNPTRQNVSTEVIISKNPDETKPNERENTPLQVNVEINVVVNYQTDDLTPDTPTDDIKDAAEGDEHANNATPQSSEEPTTTVETTAAGNFGSATVRLPNIIFPGPMSTVPQDPVHRVQFPDTAAIKDKVVVPVSCPEGLVMTEKGYCLMPINGEQNRKNTVVREYVSRSDFVGGCMKGYSRAIDGSCQPVIYD
ncbi:unnamed protein product, partial [Iphiclides podalirius]